jgi:DNA-directed RNA polymerase specialized sigma24 family protein
MTAGGELEMDDQIARLLALQIRFTLDSQTQAILELGRVGFGPKRIAQLLGTTADTAKVTLARAKKKPAKKAASGG